MRLSLVASLSLLIAAGAIAAPLSKQAALKIMHERHEGMEAVGKANKVLRREATADAPDIAAVRSAAARISNLAEKSANWFPQGTGPDVGKTGAKAEIWTDPQDFAAKVRDFQAASKALHRAAAGGKLTEIKAGYAALGRTCKACHDSYRADMH